MEETIVKELVMRNATRDDLSLIVAFIERLREGGGYFYRTSDFYDWKYFQNKTARTYLRLAVHNGQIVSMKGLIPERMKIGDQVITCFQAADAFTLPSYRGKGVYGKLNRQVLAEADTEGAKLMWAVPSVIIAPIAPRFGHTPVFYIKRFYYVLNVENFLRGILKNRLAFYALRLIARVGARIAFKDVAAPMLDGLDVTEISHFDDDVTDLWKRVSKDYDLMIVRDKEYLNWRYAASPVKFTIYTAHREGRLVGYIVITIAEKILNNVRVGFIVDLLTDPDEEKAAQSLTAAAFTYFKNQKVDVISTYAMKHDSATSDNFRRFLRRLGFMPSRSTSYVNMRTKLNLPANCRYFFRFGDLDHV